MIKVPVKLVCYLSPEAGCMVCDAPSSPTLCSLISFASQTPHSTVLLQQLMRKGVEGERRRKEGSRNKREGLYTHSGLSVHCKD